MPTKFNIERPPISDDEINKNKNFDQLLKQFKNQSIAKAREDRTWWKNKKIVYRTIIAGAIITCTVTYLALFNNSKNNTTVNDKLTTNVLKPAPIEKFIQAPSTALKQSTAKYTVNSNKDQVITHNNSQIKIPKNTFVNKQGEEIVGDVTIEYQEYHDAADIIVSGIPMQYDSAGTKKDFESAGMFKINGTQNSEQIYIRAGKTIDVEMASQNAENKFNQYYLDTIAKKWNYIKKDEAQNIPQQKTAFANANKKVTPTIESNPKLTTLRNQIDVLIPKKIDSVKTVYTKKIELLPKYKEPNKPSRATGRPNFVLDGNYNEFPELKAFDKLLFEVGDENKNYNKDFHEITWSDLKVKEGPQKGKNYLLELTYRNRKEKLIVYPVLEGADLEKAEKTYSKSLGDYNSLLTKRNEQEEKLKAEMLAKQTAYITQQKMLEEKYKKEKDLILAQMQQSQANQLQSQFKTMDNQTKATRLFTISNFGIYNSDCPHARPNDNSVRPIFVHNSNPLNPNDIYVVDHSRKVVYRLDRSAERVISYNANSIYSICIFQKNKIYLSNKESFAATISENGNKFNVTPISESADNIVDLKKALEL